jgi:hypothetical protein
MGMLILRARNHSLRSLMLADREVRKYRGKKARIKG